MALPLVLPAGPPCGGGPIQNAARPPQQPGSAPGTQEAPWACRGLSLSAASPVSSDSDRLQYEPTRLQLQLPSRNHKLEFCITSTAASPSPSALPAVRLHRPRPRLNAPSTPARVSPTTAGRRLDNRLDSIRLDWDAAIAAAATEVLDPFSALAPVSPPSPHLTSPRLASLDSPLPAAAAAAVASFRPRLHPARPRACLSRPQRLGQSSRRVRAPPRAHRQEPEHHVAVRQPRRLASLSQRNVPATKLHSAPPGPASLLGGPATTPSLPLPLSLPSPTPLDLRLVAVVAPRPRPLPLLSRFCRPPCPTSSRESAVVRHAPLPAVLHLSPKLRTLPSLRAGLRFNSFRSFAATANSSRVAVPQVIPRRCKFPAPAPGTHHLHHPPLPSRPNARFRGGSSKPPGQQKSPSPSTAGPPAAPSPDNLSQASQSSTNLAPKVPPLPNSPSLAQTIGMDESSGVMSSGDDIINSYHLPRPLPLWVNGQYIKHIVKGNFMTLSARPKTVEQGEWIAHQIVEHYRNLWNFVRVVHEKEDNGTSICNATSCPRMSAGGNHSFTWLNKDREPVELPAYEYMTLMQRWISGKIDDTNIFPTDATGVSYAHNPAITTTPLSQLSNPGDPEWIGKRSGFPEKFIDVCQMIFRQMFRVYAHLYWAHFTEPFYHLNLEKQLNSCFSHFVLTATALDMLRAQELEPMQPLLDIWAANGTFPPESKAYEYANLRAGERLLEMAGVDLESR
ncbi:hypothetical protein Purlil1_2513 [Purpureocillium lilacinum]|uniref:Mob1/phocein n=1 Tax=Purpureocillium lilacinum TaxID=33203 RepID=A0ABR0CAG0_PURLI|nr:hypothetical protein Purlil1_2513 [Purpureocillium lilacinum]